MPNKDITLYLDGSAPPPVVVVTEADTAWTFRFTVMYQNAIYAPTVANVVLAGHKPDGNAFAFLGSKSGDVYQVGCNVQMTAVPGDVLAALHLLGGGNTAIPFILRVQPGGGGTAPVASASALTAYATILNRIGNFPPDLAQYVSDWLEENISGGQTIAVDNTLTVQGAAADAKATGDRIKALEDATIETDDTLTVEGAAADAAAVGAAIDIVTDEVELLPYDTTDGRDLMANGSTIAGTNNIWYYRDLPKRVHIVGSSALGSNKAVVWVVNGSTMLSAPITGTNEDIDRWIELPDNATGIWISNPATPTVSVKARSAKDLYAREVADKVNQTTEETPLSYYAVDSGHHMTVNGTLSNYSSANIWKFKDLPDRVHVTGSSTGFSGSIAVMWWVAEGAMVSAPIYGSHSVIDKWFDVPDGVEELWLNDGGGTNRLTTLTAVDVVARGKTAALEEAVTGAVSIGSQWAGKNWFAYGTSITGGSKMKYPPYLAQMSGLLLNNKGIGGEGIGDLGAGSTGKVYDAICNITDGKLAADLITLETGANDIGDDVPLGTIYDTGRTTLSGCLNDCIRYLQANTDAQIVVTVSPATKTMPSASWKYYEWAEMVEKICKINRVHFINGDNGMGYAKLTTQGKGSLYVIDPIHQTDLGGYIMAQNIWYQLRNIPLFYTQLPV